MKLEKLAFITEDGIFRMEFSAGNLGEGAQLTFSSGSIDEEDEKIIENMSRMIVRKLLRFPMMEINASAGTEREQFYIDAMNKLFKLDFIEEDAESESEAHYRYAQQ